MNRRVAGHFFGIGVAALAAFAAGNASFAAEAGKTASTATAPAVSLPREAIKAAAQLRDTALASDEAYQLLESLTTEVGPRFAGTAGDLAGVNWSRETLQSLGFVNVRTPEVIVPRWIRGEASAQTVSPYPQAFVTLAIGGSIGTSDEGITAPVVMVKDIPELQSLPADAVKGKLVFFNGRMERTRDGGGFGRWAGGENRGGWGALS